MKNLLFISFLVFSLKASSQLNVNNFNEIQIGNAPGDEPSDLITNYDQLNLLYMYKNIRGSIRYEHFIHPDLQKEYHRITKYNFNYRKKGLELQIGHFNETLGNGILLRSYEIPASVFEGQAYRIRYGFYRDLRGFSASYNHKFFNIKILRARSLLNLLPPTFQESERRPDLSEAVQLGTRVFSQNIGLILLRNHNSGTEEDFASIFINGYLFNALSYNMEYARELNDPSYFKTNGESSFGFYGSLSYTAGSFGLSLEYKDYQNISFGSGISDPPTLIREQSYLVLNRSTHIPLLDDESGFQTEIYYSFAGGDLITLNYAYTKNQLARDYIFQEYFAEYEHGFSEYDVLRIFVDYSRDPIRLENDRYSGGFFIESLTGKNLGISFQGENQYFKRELSESQTVNNAVFIASTYMPSKWSVAVNLEASTDPLQIALLPEPENKNIRLWPGISGSWQINSDNKLTFFAGQRRGGPACTSGICYEVLDFEGIELRLTTKL